MPVVGRSAWSDALRIPNHTSEADMRQTHRHATDAVAICFLCLKSVTPAPF